YLGNNFGTLVGGTMGRALVLQDVSPTAAIAVRGVTSMGLIQVQKGIHKQVMTPEHRASADAIANYNTAHFAIRLPINHGIDQAFVKWLPTALFDACKGGGALRVFVSSRMIRIYERGVSAIIYYGGRQVAVGQ